jgi:hypothetical protein
MQHELIQYVIKFPHFKALGWAVANFNWFMFMAGNFHLNPVGVIAPFGVVID